MADVRRSDRSHNWRAAVWSSLAAAGLLVLGTIGFFGWQSREAPWMGHDPCLRNLAHLMGADQKGEIEVFRQWWRSWFEGDLPPASPQEHASMPGMLSGEQMESLRRANGMDFDPLFVTLMTMHHKGAIAMADEALREAGDIRLRLMAHATRHAQRGEIELMRGSEGWAAVKSATLSLIVPAGEAPAEQKGQAPPAHRH